MHVRRLIRLAVCSVALTIACVPLAAVPHAEAKGFLGSPVYRLYNQVSGTHFYTISQAEADAATSTYPHIFVGEGIAYYVEDESAYDGGIARTIETRPLHRFFNKRNGTHFYTASEQERARIEADYSSVYEYEGVAYQVFTGTDAALAGLAPVYRFYNKQNGAHFYTSSEIEKLQVRLHLGTLYTYEGIAFYVWGNDLRVTD